MEQLIEATCPECRGPLRIITHDQNIREYKCLVGHTYSARSLLAAHSEAQEKALWASVVALEEAEKIVGAVSPELPVAVAERLHVQAELKLAQAKEIRAVLERLEPFMLDSSGPE